MCVTVMMYIIQWLPSLLQSRDSALDMQEKKRKGKVMLFSEHNGSLPRRQPRPPWIGTVRLQHDPRLASLLHTRVPPQIHPAFGMGCYVSVCDVAGQFSVQRSMLRLQQIRSMDLLPLLFLIHTR